MTPIPHKAFLVKEVAEKLAMKYMEIWRSSERQEVAKAAFIHGYLKAYSDVWKERLEEEKERKGRKHERSMDE